MNQNQIKRLTWAVWTRNWRFARPVAALALARQVVGDYCYALSSVRRIGCRCAQRRLRELSDVFGGRIMLSAEVLSSGKRQKRVDLDVGWSLLCCDTEGDEQQRTSTDAICGKFRLKGDWR